MHITDVCTGDHDVELVNGALIRKFCVLYDCEIGAGTKIASHCTIGRCTIGERCKIQDGTVICDGHVIEDGVFVGALVNLGNDMHPSACKEDGSMVGPGDWDCTPVTIKKGAAIGSGVMICPGVTIGEGALIGMGSVVTKDVAPGTTVVGNPAHVIVPKPVIDDYRGTLEDQRAYDYPGGSLD